MKNIFGNLKMNDVWSTPDRACIWMRKIWTIIKPWYGMKEDSTELFGLNILLKL